METKCKLCGREYKTEDYVFGNFAKCPCESVSVVKNKVEEEEEVVEDFVMIDGKVEVYKIEDDALITSEGDYRVFQTSGEAGQVARDYYENMANNDPEELKCLVGTDTLVKWALGQYASPGSVQVQSLEEWLDLWLDIPEELWASYDGVEVEGTLSSTVREDLGFESCEVVLYKC